MKNQTVKNHTCFKTREPKVQKWIFIYTWIDYFKSDFDSSNFHAFFFFFCKMVMYIWWKAKDNCIYYLSHWNIKTVQSKSATREYLGTLITILQLTSSSLMSISWVYSLFPVLYINTVKSVLATICIKQ